LARVERPDDLEATARTAMWNPEYPSFI
jgi:hypothetical protein